MNAPKYTFCIPNYKTSIDEVNAKKYFYDLETHGNNLDELYENCRVFQLTGKFTLVNSYKECGDAEKRAISFWHFSHLVPLTNPELKEILNSVKELPNV